MRLPHHLFSSLLSLLAAGTAFAAGPEAVVLVTGDQHSAYERTAQLVAQVDRLQEDNPGLPMLILLDGDTLEAGNGVARRSAGAVDFAMFAALARRAPTILNLGNHEPEFYDLAETVQRVQAAGVTVVSNLGDHATGRLFAPASTRIKLGREEAVVVGVATDSRSTYREAVRPSLDLADPVAWAEQNVPALLAEAPLPIVLSHAGIKADRDMLPLVPAGTLFAGAHDHQRFIHPFDHGVYVHSGSWNEYLTIAWLYRDEAGGPRWVVEQIALATDGPADPELAALIARTRQEYLTAEDTAVIGHTAAALSPGGAARFVARALRLGAGVDAAFIGNTTFGAGLPEGAVTRAEFDACVRFDGTVCTAEVTGDRLQQLLAAANLGPDTPFAERHGEFCQADGPADIDPAGKYRIATTDWGAKNTVRYFGEPAIVWREVPRLSLKALVIDRLTRERTATFPESTPDVESLLEIGRQLFEEYAPEEIKEEFEFPSKADWDEFAARLQQALESNDLRRLAAYEPEARAALLALRALPEYQDYADWLAERLDYIEGAKKSVPSRVPRPAPPPVVPGPEPAPVPALAEIPNYQLWLERMRGREAPARAAALVPRLQQIFSDEGMPPELVWLAESESTFNPAARSPVGAKGLFQFMPETAKSLGLQTFLPDERTNPEKSARAAAQYLRHLHHRFGDWPLALAAYNAGEGRVSRALTGQKARTFGEIADVLPAETRMYVPKVLATIEVRAGVNPGQLAVPRS